MPRALRQFLPLLAALVLLQVLFRAIVPNFWAHDNLLDLTQQISVNAILAFGMTLTIMIRGIDLSVGALLALVGTASVWTLTQGHGGFALALLAGLAVAAAFGLLNGALTALTRIPAFIVTLATMQVARGLALCFNHARPMSVPSNEGAYWFLGNGKLLEFFPMPVAIMLAVFVALTYGLHFTVFGRHLYAIGGNREAAHYAGIPLAKRELAVFVLCSLCAGISGMIQTSQLYSAEPAGGVGFELNAIAAAVVGGASLAGGAGTTFGTLLGALIIGTLDKGLNQAGVHFSLQYIVKGLVILAAVFADMRQRKVNQR